MVTCFVALFSCAIHQESPGRLGCRLLRPPFSQSTTAKLKLSALARTFAMRVSQWVTRHRYPLKYNSKYECLAQYIPHQNCYVKVYSMGQTWTNPNSIFTTSDPGGPRCGGPPLQRKLQCPGSSPECLNLSNPNPQKIQRI